MKNQKIMWKKMHTKNYDGSCAFCGTGCHDEESIKEWQKAEEEISKIEELLHFSNDPALRRRYNYLTKKLQQHLSYYFT